MVASTFRRHRGVLFAALALVIVLGLASRLYAPVLPNAVGRYAGDTLWATAVYLGLGLVWPTARASRLALAAALLSLSVELSQLAHPAWLETVRSWPGVGLLIGHDFVWTDLACYAAGVLLGFGLDRLGRARPGMRHAAERRRFRSTPRLTGGSR